MLSVLNPKPAPVDATAPHVAFKDVVLAQITAAPAAMREITFDSIRAALGVDAKSLPDGAIMQIALDAGLKVGR